MINDLLLISYTHVLNSYIALCFISTSKIIFKYVVMTTYNRFFFFILNSLFDKNTTKNVFNVAEKYFKMSF